MNYKITPLLYFLPSVIMVDDNQSFLDNFSMELEYRGFLEKYKSPRKAIENINGRDNIFNSWKEYINVIEYDDIDGDSEMRSINFDSIIKVAFNKKRFCEPAVIIVDYDMPEMNGVDFCKYIKDNPSQKIMLTGKAEHKIAVEAFNTGLINQFILKDINSTKREVIDAIDKHITQYFINFSKCLWQIGSSIFFCDAYIDVLNKWIKEKNISEYYSISNNGSKLGITNDGKIRWFILNSETDIERYTDIAIDYGLSKNIIEALKSGKIQLALLTEEQKKEPVSNWKNYVMAIDGRFHYNEHDINYSFTDEFSINSIDNNQIQKIYSEKNKKEAI